MRRSTLPIVALTALITLVLAFNVGGVRDRFAGAFGGISTDGIDNPLPEGGQAIVPVLPLGLAHAADSRGGLARSSDLEGVVQDFVASSMKVIDDVSHFDDSLPVHMTLGKESNVKVVDARDGPESCRDDELKTDDARPVIGGCRGKFLAAEVTIVGISQQRGTKLKLFAAMVIAYAQFQGQRDEHVNVSRVAGALLRRLVEPCRAETEPKLNAQEAGQVMTHLTATWAKLYGLNVAQVRAGYKTPPGCPVAN